MVVDDSQQETRIPDSSFIRFDTFYDDKNNPVKEISVEKRPKDKKDVLFI
jgi:hypothetical protein